MTREEKRQKRTEKEGKERKRRGREDGQKPPNLHFWQRHCMPSWNRLRLVL